MISLATSSQGELLPGLVAPDLHTVEGVVSRIRHENNDSGFRIVVVQVESRLETWVGVMPKLREGMSVKGMGKWTTHAKFGKQFDTTLVLPVQPRTEAGIAEWIGSCGVKGIGPRLAESIVKTFGTDTLELLETVHAKAAAGEPLAILELKALIAGLFVDWTLADAGQITQRVSEAIFAASQEQLGVPKSSASDSPPPSTTAA